MKKRVFSFCFIALWAGLLMLTLAGVFAWWISAASSSKTSVALSSPDKQQSANIVYCVAVTNTNQIPSALKMIEALFDERHAFIVQLENSISDDAARFLVRGLRAFGIQASMTSLSAKSNVLLRHNLQSDWVGFSVLENELLCMQEALRSTRWDYFVNLDAMTFPLVSSTELELFLGRSAPMSFVDVIPFAEKQNWHYRFQNAKVQCDNTQCTSTPHNNMIYFGSQWVQLHRSLCEYIFNRNVSFFGEWETLYRQVQVPGESFYQTIAMQATSQDSKLYPLHAQTLTFLKWNSDGCTNPSDGNSPCLLDYADLPEHNGLKNSSWPVRLFAKDFGSMPCFLDHIHCEDSSTIKDHIMI